MFFNKLALSDFRKNAREEKMFLLATVGICALNVIIHLLQNNTKTLTTNGVNTTAQLLFLGEFLIGFFSIIFLVYIHNFLMKSKTKTYGLYYILGLSRFDLVKISFFAKMWNFIFSMIGGILTGIVFSKASILLLGKMMNVHNLTLIIHLKPIVAVILLFLIIFLGLLFINILVIIKTSPIEMLRAEKMGEKEPKSRWVLSIIGLILLGIGYSIAISIKDKDPLKVLPLFFGASLSVIVGTYLLFIAGTITLLKFLKKRERIFYQPQSFISISGMIFRMKQNGTSLANISILLTMTLVSLIVTINLALGVDRLSFKYFPKEIAIASPLPENECQTLLIQAANQNGVALKKVVNYQMTGLLIGTLSNHIMSSEGISTFQLMTEKQFSKLEHKNLNLQSNQMIIFTYNPQFQKEDYIQFGKNKYQVDKVLYKIKNLPSATENIKSFIFIVKDEAEIQKIIQGYSELSASDSDQNKEKRLKLNTYALFDISGTQKNKEKFFKQLQALPAEQITIRSRKEFLSDFKSITIGLLFIGIILGTGFILATSLVIYYKQISEGYADAKNFEILQKVGLNHQEIKKVINLQIFWTFFLPVGVTVLHISFAMPMILKILSIFGLYDIQILLSFSAIIILGIVALYYMIYKLTSKAYYKQVE